MGQSGVSGTLCNAQFETAGAMTESDQLWLESLL